MLSGGRSSPSMPINVLDSQQGNTGDFSHIFIPLHLTCTKNGKGHILTVVSNMHYFNCLCYEMVQHKLNQELTKIIQASYVTHCKIKSNIYNSGIIHSRYKKKGFTDKILTAKRSVSSSSTAS